jgi:hypothetical protein
MMKEEANAMMGPTETIFSGKKAGNGKFSTSSFLITRWAVMENMIGKVIHTLK